MDSTDFFNLFDLNTEEYIKKYIWDGTQQEVGFSITKSYPKNISFKPALKKDGSDDTVMLIKFYLPAHHENLCLINITISKISLYQLDNTRISHHFDFNDPQSPTEESLKESLKGFQPINLEESKRFSINLTDKTFFDTKKRKQISGHSIVEHIYKEHLATVTSPRGYILRFRMWSNSVEMRLLEYLGKFLVQIIPFLCGKEIKNKAHNFFLEPFYWANARGAEDKTSDRLIEYENLLKKINPFIFSIVTGLILFLYILNYYYEFDFLNIISLIQKNRDDQVFSVTVIAFTILFFNYIFPNILLFVLNSFIRLFKKAGSRRFEL